MKNFWILLFSLMASSLFMVSCTDDEDGEDPNAPQITVTGGDMEVEPGTFADYTLSIQPGRSDLQSYRVLVDGQTADISDFLLAGASPNANPILLEGSPEEEGFTTSISFLAPNSAGTSRAYEIEATDVRDRISTSGVITVSTPTDVQGPELTVNGSTSISIPAGSSADFEITAVKGGADLTEISFLRDGTTLAASEIRVADGQGGYNALSANPLSIEGADAEGFTATYNLKASINVGTAILYTVILEDIAGNTTELELTITAEPTFTTENFTFERCGANPGTGLDQYGLSWEANTSDAAIIKKDADKLVDLTGSVNFGDVDSRAQIQTLVDGGTDIDDYRGISVTQSSTYDEVIGTKVGNDYYLLNITNADVSSESCGTRVIITGVAKF